LAAATTKKTTIATSPLQKGEGATNSERKSSSNVKAFIFGFPVLLQGKPKRKQKLDNTPRRPRTTIHRQTSQIPQRKHRPSPTTNMGNTRQNRQSRREAASKSRLVVHTRSKHPPQSLRPRTHRHRKTPQRLRRKERLHGSTQPRRKSGRKQHPKNPPTTRKSRTTPNHHPTRKTHVTKRKKTPPRSRRRPAQRTRQNSPRTQQISG
jgi:hypothetical protein